MIALLRRLFADRHSADAGPPPPAGAGLVAIPDGDTIDLNQGARRYRDVQRPDWRAVHRHIRALPATLRPEVTLAVQRAWLDWLRGSIGLHYRLYESDTALLLTDRSPRQAQVKLDYLAVTERRIERALEQLADASGKEVLIALADADDYYRYVSGFYPVEGEFAMSSGVFLSEGCRHFVTHGDDIGDLEPVIVHEMTHSCLAHLRLPRWLDEGIAQSVEFRFVPFARNAARRRELQARHRAFWNAQTIQKFWSGEAFGHAGEINELAYDLALTLTETLARDWNAFKSFTLAANRQDAGRRAAREHLGIDLGEFVRLLHDQPENANGSPLQA